MRLLRALVSWLRSPIARWVFLAVAVGGAAWFVARSWHDLERAADELSVGTVLATTGLGLVYVWCTMLAWRVLLADLGSPLSLPAAFSVFGISQVGKYVPGGVWNVVAAAEIGSDHSVPRARSLAAMAVAVLVSVVSGSAVGALTVPFLAAGSLGQWSWVAWAAPVVVVALLPPVLNRLIGVALRIGRREPLEHPLTWQGLGRATAWSVAGWAVAGTQLWVLATGVGMQVSTRSFALAVGGWALAWVVGFLVVVVPAGAGVREAVLAIVLAAWLSPGAVTLTVLVSRVVLTAVDFAFAGVGLVLARRRRNVTVPR
ncbi:lysylphosphatidylglycerol synthase domain-containing protein [Antribacter gilvus]|uniref:lysylphosphatidylglycerol synthase domain-containing protein n=1 Tax=Antribacter gilvus TaxID=2304675 RepID=UPI000F788DBD|nr:lysylphosphatidylglycerol synthase domain-containing protein [Antribacter gilvus]